MLIRRLRNGWTWLRHTYPFQFAHGPLCERYEADTVRLGHVFLCRSCAALYATLALATAALLLEPPSATTLRVALGITAAVVFPLSWPPLYKPLPRLVRDLLRGGAGLLVALTLAALLRGMWLTGGLAVATMLVALVVFSRVRRRQRVHMCDGCPELGADGVCSGYAVQAGYLRRYEDAMAARVGPSIEAALRARESRVRAKDERVSEV